MDESPFDQDFCDFLEHHLSAAFYNSRNNKFKYLWCDGIAIPDDEQELTIVSISKNKQVITSGWFGYDGQEPYTFTIIFGPGALEAYAKGLNLTDYVPGDDTLDWVTLDMENLNIKLRLQ